MKQYKVEITKEALQDMEDIYNYIAIDLLAPDNAMGQYNRIADEILTLDTFPERFRIMDSEPEKRMELRRMLVDNYSVFYTIRDERVIVTDVLYTASDIEASFERRAIKARVYLNLKRSNNAMNFFENTRKPQGFGGKLMTKMMNIGHAKLSQWGFSNISVNPDAAVLDVGCGGGANIIG